MNRSLVGLAVLSLGLTAVGAHSQNIPSSQLLLMPRANSILPFTVDYGAGAPYRLALNGRDTGMVFGDPARGGGYQQFPSPFGGTTTTPGTGFPPGSSGLNPFQQALPAQPLAQFQPGVTPGAFLQVPAGGTRTLAAYCGDLEANAPTAAVNLLSDPGAGQVRLANYTLPVRDAQLQGLLSIRGHDDFLDGARTDGGGWLDLHVVNRSPYDMDVRLDAGTVLTPVGQTRPELDPKVVALLQQESKAGLDGAPEAVMAMWAARGSSAQDVLEQNFRLIPQLKLAAVQRLLDQSGIHRSFAGGDRPYLEQYQKSLAALGPKTETIRLHFELSDGSPVNGVLTRNAAGDGVLDVTPRMPTQNAAAPPHLYYSAQVSDEISGGFSVSLIHPKTGQALSGVETLEFGKAR